MRRISSVALLVAAALFLVSAVAFAQPRTRQRMRARASQPQVVIPRGTDVMLAFGQPLNSTTAGVGQRVRLRTVSDVVVGNRVIMRAGTPVTAVVSRVSKRKAFGVNASIRLVLNPVRSLAGVMIPLQPRTQGAPVGGQKSAQAAGATVGGAAVLGPVGLVGGYFIKGKPVNIKVGDRFDTEVARNVVLRGSQVARLPRMSVAAAALPAAQPNQQIAALPMGQQYQCVPVTCVPVQSAAAPPVMQPSAPVQPQAAAPQCVPAPSATAPTAAPSAQGLQCPVPVAAAPEVSAAASTAVAPPPTATTPTYESKNFCAGFPDLPTAMDHGYSC